MTWERRCRGLWGPKAHATSGSRHRRSQVTLTVTLARLQVLVLRSFPRIFEEKRDCSQSMLMRPNKAETAFHGCRCPGDMAACMR